MSVNAYFPPAALWYSQCVWSRVPMIWRRVLFFSLRLDADLLVSTAPLALRYDFWNGTQLAGKGWVNLAATWTDIPVRLSASLHFSGDQWSSLSSALVVCCLGARPRRFGAA